MDHFAGRSVDSIRPLRPTSNTQALLEGVAKKAVDFGTVKKPVPISYRILQDLVVYSTVAVCLYVLLAPFLPSVAHEALAHFSYKTVTAYQDVEGGARAALGLAPQGQAQPPQASKTLNKLTMQSIGVDGEIFEGQTEDALKKGIWHMPGTSNPEDGGNTVLAAHRFLYLSGGSTFYALDQAKPGDTFTLNWNGKKYVYTVFLSEVVSDRAVNIKQNTADSIVTLFTCTPLWTSKDRLVVQAKLTSVQ